MLTSYDGSAVTHDALGNILSFNGYTYTWQAGRRLAGMTNGMNTYGYKYDDNGVRTEKTVNGVTTHYLTVDGRITGQYDGTDTLYFRYNADNSPIGFSLNGEEYLYLKNIQGDVEEIVDKNGNSVVKYAYNEWGKLLSVTGSMAAAVGRINPIRYRGYYYDGETGYYYLQSRYYNPDICRFINADDTNYIGSSGIVSSFNLFLYCNNNPVVYFDPYGNDAIYVVDYNHSSGIPVIGHSVLCFQDYRGTWYYTEYTGTSKKNAAVALGVINYKVATRLFSNINSHYVAYCGTKAIYIKGDYSGCLSKAQYYAKRNFGKYNLITNNCLTYVKKILTYGKYPYGLKLIYNSKTIISPNAFGNALITYYHLKIANSVFRFIMNKSIKYVRVWRF